MFWEGPGVVCVVLGEGYAISIIEQNITVMLVELHHAEHPSS